MNGIDGILSLRRGLPQPFDLSLHVQGKPVYELPEETPSVTALFGILQSLRVP
jgi:hypothetical protein